MSSNPAIQKLVTKFLAIRDALGFVSPKKLCDPTNSQLFAADKFTNIQYDLSRNNRDATLLVPRHRHRRTDVFVTRKELGPDIADHIILNDNNLEIPIGQPLWYQKIKNKDQATIEIDSL